MFDKLIHADWSTNPNKKWMAIASKTEHGWSVAAPRRVPADADLNWLFDRTSQKQATLAGFDFPIGLPQAFAEMTGFPNFLQALSEFGNGAWKNFFSVCDLREEIEMRRPFFPAKNRTGVRHADLLGALGLERMDELRRQCERQTAGRRAACPIFWTLGANQVGKAAIDGWINVVRPALDRGAQLWPFHGRLNEISKSKRLVVCETYPQEAYAHIGVGFKRMQSKRVQADRICAGRSILDWARKHGVHLSDEARAEIEQGFGNTTNGEDKFDAVAGLLSIIEVADNRRAEGAPSKGDVWEGWILGQSSSTGPGVEIDLSQT